MSFSTQQIERLEGPLSRSAVSERKQGGMKLSYIEGWFAIAEANRIFGFDKWARETISLDLDHDSQFASKGRDGYRCTYSAKVRITVYTEDGAVPIVREGTGSGHGVTYGNPGDAHESAQKEAETDAMKRALMTFGNPFGLALYDKTQANVIDDSRKGNVVKAKEAFKGLKDEIANCGDLEQLDTYLSADRTVKLINRLREVIPEWTEDTPDIPGIDGTIKNRRIELEKTL